LVSLQHCQCVGIDSVDILLTFHMMRRHITGNEASQAVGMLQARQVQRTVAGHFNVSQSVISRYVTRLKKEQESSDAVANSHDLLPTANALFGVSRSIWDELLVGRHAY
jgi:hypothetical protein